MNQSTRGINGILKNFTRICFKNYNKHYVFGESGSIIGTKEEKFTLVERLKERYQLSLVEYPDNEMFDEFLRSIYNEIEIPIITHLNMLPMDVEELAGKLETPLEEVNRIVDQIAERGLMFDISMYSESDKRFVMLPEFIVGWYEVSVVHANTHKSTNLPDDVDFYELMKMYEMYGNMYISDSYINMDSFCHRVAPFDLTEDDEVFFVDYETARGVIENSERIGVMGCVCKMHQDALGNTLNDEAVTERCCMVLDEMVELAVSLDIGNELEKEEAFDLLKELADNNHMHQPENNQHPRFLCNCHPKWCNVTLTIRDLLREHVTVTSNFVPVFDPTKCVRCGKCAKRCPLSIIDVSEDAGAHVIDPDLCLGCLSCKYGCDRAANAISCERVSKEKEKKIPVDFIEHMVNVAFERNKLNTLLFDDPQKLSHRLLRKVFSFVERNPFAESVKNIEFVNSKFLEVFVRKAREEFEKKLQ